MLFLLVQVVLLAQQVKKMGVEDLGSYIAKSEKPLIVSFWATWCGSCNEEIPYFISTICTTVQRTFSVAVVPAPA